MNQMATLKVRAKRNTHKKEGEQQQKPLTPPPPIGCHNGLREGGFRHCATSEAALMQNISSFQLFCDLFKARGEKFYTVTAK